jgi:hypothetical protein
MNLTFIESHEFEIDGHSYSIGVYQSASDFVAFCDCTKCQGHNVRTTPKPSKEAAIQECRDLLTKHHSECHTCAA